VRWIDSVRSATLPIGKRRDHLGFNHQKESGLGWKEAATLARQSGKDQPVLTHARFA
jgi:hypothetical protein